MEPCRCFSHTLQLAVDKVLHLRDEAKAVARCKQLVGHFSHSYYDREDFGTATMMEAIGGQEWVTISSVRPLIHKLRAVKPSDSDHRFVKEMKKIMLDKLNEYYGHDCDLSVFDKAMLLDPRFKNASFMSSDCLLQEMAAASPFG